MIGTDLRPLKDCPGVSAPNCTNSKSPGWSLHLQIVVHSAWKGLITQQPPHKFGVGDLMQYKPLAVPSASQILDLVPLWKKKLHDSGFHGLNTCELWQVVWTEFRIAWHHEERVAFGCWFICVRLCTETFSQWSWEYLGRFQQFFAVCWTQSLGLAGQVLTVLDC